MTGEYIKQTRAGTCAGIPMSEAKTLFQRLAYRRPGEAAVTPIGIDCRLCERADCAERALPPISRKLIVDEHRRDITPFTFVDYSIKPP